MLAMYDGALVSLLNLYNHAKEVRNNGWFRIETGVQAEFYAIRAIEAGEKIGYDYTQPKEGTPVTNKSYNLQH